MFEGLEERPSRPSLVRETPSPRTAHPPRARARFVLPCRARAHHGREDWE